MLGLLCCWQLIMVFFSIYLWVACFLFNNCTNSEQFRTATRRSAAVPLICCAACREGAGTEEGSWGALPARGCRPPVHPTPLPDPRGHWGSPGSPPSQSTGQIGCQKKEGKVFCQFTPPSRRSERKQTRMARAGRRDREEGRSLCLVAVSCQIRLAVS